MEYVSILDITLILLPDDVGMTSTKWYNNSSRETIYIGTSKTRGEGDTNKATMRMIEPMIEPSKYRPLRLALVVLLEGDSTEPPDL